MSSYFEINCNEDGLTISKFKNKDELQQQLNSGEIRVSPSSSKALDNGGMVSFEENWDNYQSIIIKGEVVVPREVERVTEYEID